MAGIGEILVLQKLHGAPGIGKPAGDTSDHGGEIERSRGAACGLRQQTRNVAETIPNSASKPRPSGGASTAEGRPGSSTAI